MWSLGEEGDFLRVCIRLKIFFFFGGVLFSYDLFLFVCLKG